MRPEDHRPTTPLVIPSRPMAVPSAHRSAQNDAAANIARSQIDSIYRQDPHMTAPVQAASTTQPDETPAPAAAQSASDDNSLVQNAPDGQTTSNLQVTHQQQKAENPYDRTHNERQHNVDPTAWQKYHSAWQSYYQQYYERYYTSQVSEAKKSLEAQTAVHRGVEPTAEATISSDEAMYDLRAKLRGRINERAAKVRKSRHFMPTMAALAVMFVFLFLQYNRVVFAAIDAYVRPGNLDPANLIVDPNAAGSVTLDPRLVIPTISVDVPIVWDAVASNQESLNSAMDRGIAWFNIPGANAKPGQMGNLVLSGHSSNDWLDKGEYKFIFAPLERMKKGDAIYVNYEGKRYTYTITRTQVVKPTDIHALQIGNDKPYITLITCTPLGTALNRLLVFGEQVSPDPKAATAAKETADDSAETAKMPANSPTFFERIFGIRN